MSLRSWLAVAALSAAILFVTGALVGAQVMQRWTPTNPTVLAGDDVGFRVKWMGRSGLQTDGRFVMGDLLVRVNGQWIEARIGEPPHADVMPVPPPAPAPPPPPPIQR